MNSLMHHKTVRSLAWFGLVFATAVIVASIWKEQARLIFWAAGMTTVISDSVQDLARIRKFPLLSAAYWVVAGGALYAAIWLWPNGGSFAFVLTIALVIFGAVLARLFYTIQ